MILKSIEELLTGNQFKKSNSSFTRVVNDVVQILEFQKYTFKIDGYSAFTLNIGFVVPDIFQKITGKAVTPSAAEGIIYINVGELINDFKGRVINKAWTLNDYDQLKVELENLLKETVIPFFNSIDTRKAIITFLDGNRIVGNTALVKLQHEELRL